MWVFLWVRRWAGKKSKEERQTYTILRTVCKQQQIIAVLKLPFLAQGKEQQGRMVDA